MIPLEEENIKNNSLIRGFYNKFPYLSHTVENTESKFFYWPCSFDMVQSYCGIYPNNSFSNRKSPRILEAGCGSGFYTNQIAHLNPGADILAVDISRKSLDLAEERLKISGAFQKSEIKFKNIDIQDLDLKNEFDYIYSAGMLPHVLSPSKIIVKFNSLMKEQSILYLEAYSELGRFYSQCIQSAFRKLRLSALNTDVSIAREILDGLPEGNPLNIEYKQKFSDHSKFDFDFADDYLNPYENSFRLEDIFNLIKLGGFSFLGFSNDEYWQLERLLGFNCSVDLSHLSQEDKYKLVESLDPTLVNFSFFLSKKSSYRMNFRNKDFCLQSFGKISPFVKNLSSRIFVNRYGVSIDLSQKDLDFLICLDQNPEKSLGSLPLSWQKTEIYSVAMHLFRKQIVLLYPP
tara:strand:+ start:65 stop:1273 length:1209 start_codon:yes stop_codon:yes gene_type:complete